MVWIHNPVAYAAAIKRRVQQEMHDQEMHDHQMELALDELEKMTSDAYTELKRMKNLPPEKRYTYLRLICENQAIWSEIQELRQFKGVDIPDIPGAEGLTPAQLAREQRRRLKEIEGIQKSF